METIITLGGKYYEKLSEKALDLGYLPDRVRGRSAVERTVGSIHILEDPQVVRDSQAHRVIALKH